MSQVKAAVLTLVGVALVFFLLYFGGPALLPGIAGDLQVDEQVDVELGEALGNRAPYFDLSNVSGDRVTLSQFADTPLIIVFWATWNSDATNQIKIIDDYLRNQDTGNLLKVVAINSQEDRSIVSSFMRRGGYAVETLIDARGEVSEAYRIKSVPTFYFIDHEGVVRSIYTGLLSERAIGDRAESILR